MTIRVKEEPGHCIGHGERIRARVAEGLGVKYLVPPEVEMYIFEHGLYQN